MLKIDWKWDLLQLSVVATVGLNSGSFNLISRFHIQLNKSILYCWIIVVEISVQQQ